MFDRLGSRKLSKNDVVSVHCAHGTYQEWFQAVFNSEHTYSLLLRSTVENHWPALTGTSGNWELLYP